MEDVYAVWILRKDGILEQLTDNEGMPMETENLQSAKSKAAEAARESYVQEVYVRRTSTIEIVPGKQA